MIHFIKNKLPNDLKSALFYLLKTKKEDIDLEKYRNRKKFFVFLAGFYQNLGDMALTYSHKVFLEENFPDYEIILVPSTKTYAWMKALKNICQKDDIITILGGGNMSDTYISLEDTRRFVIEHFPKNKIVSFPQTMIFSDTPYGEKMLRKTVKTYSNHNNLHIFTREYNSFKRMKTHFVNNNIGFIPDMVLYLNEQFPVHSRKGIICCLRNDAEKNTHIDESDMIINFLEKNYDELIITDTVNVTLEESLPENYERTLKKFWERIKKSKLVVTDRLHCMIFCAITKTPCIVYDNTNRKISGVYEACLNNIGYIKMMDKVDLDTLNKEIRFLMNINLDDYPNVNLKKFYQPLIKACSSTGI
ncbi:polysaccharide pyruvyl transferase family protein [Ferdinandcohnia quinoae]|uniref:Polysaccharide pyruvyl transferase family protein n=1 Tax=Fredinandcohnia quinoae TaxID=2918902 RepID=A0AAW5DW69_9BACI|nr:polysaccharide pyruvyl transferase family protein [Fredinandcohnia sp. SECRCQ15]MCH1624885.1 polysaccharide pyruvyl transferase family protein [Fredinandcohnia sp. SECRCQ15]